MHRDHYNDSIEKRVTMFFAHAQVLFHLKHSVWFHRVNVPSDLNLDFVL